MFTFLKKKNKFSKKKEKKNVVSKLAGTDLGSCGVTVLFNDNREFSHYSYPPKEFAKCTLQILYQNQSNFFNTILRSYGLSPKF